MINKSQRLKSNEIVLVARRGKRFSTDYFDIKAWWDNNIPPKFAVSISKSIDKKAVIRNQIRRKIKAAIFNLQKDTQFKNGKYLFIIKSVDLKDISSIDIEKFIKSVSGIFTENN